MVIYVIAFIVALMLFLYIFGHMSHIIPLLCVAGGQWTIKFGTVTLSVKQGDITRESTDAIVNSSNAALQLEQG